MTRTLIMMVTLALSSLVHCEDTITLALGMMVEVGEKKVVKFANVRTLTGKIFDNFRIERRSDAADFQITLNDKGIEEIVSYSAQEARGTSFYLMFNGRPGVLLCIGNTKDGNSSKLPRTYSGTLGRIHGDTDNSNLKLSEALYRAYSSNIAYLDKNGVGYGLPSVSLTSWDVKVDGNTVLLAYKGGGVSVKLSIHKTKASQDAFSTVCTNETKGIRGQIFEKSGENLYKTIEVAEVMENNKFIKARIVHCRQIPNGQFQSVTIDYDHRLIDEPYFEKQKEMLQYIGSITTVYGNLEQPEIFLYPITK